MIQFYYKIFRFFLVLFCFIFGLSSKVNAQYGAPSVKFQLKGVVLSDEEIPISGIQVKAGINNISGREEIIFTDKDGIFRIQKYADYYDDIKLTLKDVDGEKNDGLFKEKSVVINTYKCLSTSNPKEKERLLYINLNRVEKEIPIIKPKNLISNKSTLVDTLNVKTLTHAVTNQKSHIIKPKSNISNTPENTGNILIIPNPADDFCEIVFPFSLQQPITLELFSTDEKLVMKKTMHTNSTSVKLDLNELSSGFYILKTEIENLIYSNKLIIQKK